MEDMVLYNIVKTLDDIDKTIPTLIVGWKKVNIYFPNVKILEWKINSTIYWTFGRRERGERYESDLKRFQELCVNNLYNVIDYKFFNVLTNEKEEKQKIFNILKDKTLGNDKFIYIENNMLYYYVSDNTVYGISLTDIEYEGGNLKRFLSILYKNNTIKIIKNTDIDYNVRMMLNNKIYLVPYLFS